jgi:hypothetical protein
MATNYIQVPPSSTGLKVDTNEVTVNANVVERQSVCLADPVTPANVANVVAGLYPAQYYQLVSNAPLDGYKATYGAAVSNVSAGTALTTDIFGITGSASKTIRVLQMGFGGTLATTAQNAWLIINKCSAVPSGGTASTPAIVPFDSSDAAGTAVVNFYTATPTAGTYVGPIAATEYFFDVTATVTLVNTPLWVVNFGNMPGKAVVLRGATQGLYLRGTAFTPSTAGSMTGYIIWTEE